MQKRVYQTLYTLYVTDGAQNSCHLTEQASQQRIMDWRTRSSPGLSRACDAASTFSFTRSSDGDWDFHTQDPPEIRKKSTGEKSCRKVSISILLSIVVKSFENICGLKEIQKHNAIYPMHLKINK